MSATCLFLAAKSEEFPKSLKELCDNFCIMRGSQLSESERRDMPNKILLAERILLPTLRFDLELCLPYKKCGLDIKNKLESYIVKDKIVLFKQAVANFCNDSFRSTLCLQYLPVNVADSSILLATIQVLNGINPLNTDKTWFQLVETDIDMEILQDICMQIIDVNMIEEDSSTSLEQKNSSKNNANKLRAGLNELINPDMIHHPSPISVTDTPQISHHIHKLSKDNVDITVDYPYNQREIYERKQIPKVSYSSITPSSYTIRNPPPIPSQPPASSPCSTPSATPPPPPPPDTPSSSYQYTLPDTPNTGAPPPPPPDTPSTCQSTPAPPPPDTPVDYKIPDTPVYVDHKIPDTPNTCQNTPAPPPPPDQHGYENQVLRHECQMADQASATPAPPPPPTPEYDGMSQPFQSRSSNTINTVNTLRRPKVAPFNALFNSESSQNFKKQRIE